MNILTNKLQSIGKKLPDATTATPCVKCLSTYGGSTRTIAASPLAEYIQEALTSGVETRAEWVQTYDSANGPIYLAEAGKSGDLRRHKSLISVRFEPAEDNTLGCSITFTTECVKASNVVERDFVITRNTEGSGYDISPRSTGAAGQDPIAQYVDQYRTPNEDYIPLNCAVSKIREALILVEGGH